ncbi:hypothetical protein Tco_1541211 [Tanacetum coccineum]
MVTTRRNSDDDVPNFEAMINAVVANALPNLTAALEKPRAPMTSRMFTKLKPLAFRSAATPAEAEDWITHTEKLLQVLGCPDNFKTRLAAFKLEGDALSWWKAYLRTQKRICLPTIFSDLRWLELLKDMTRTFQYHPQGKLLPTSKNSKDDDIMAIVRMMKTVNILSSVLIDGVVWFEDIYVFLMNRITKACGTRLKVHYSISILKPMDTQKDHSDMENTLRAVLRMDGIGNEIFLLGWSLSTIKVNLMKSELIEITKKVAVATEKLKEVDRDQRLC